MCVNKFFKCNCRKCKRKTIKRKELRKEVLYKNGIDFRRLFEEKEETFPSNFDELWKKVKTTIVSKGCTCALLHDAENKLCRVCEEFNLVTFRVFRNGKDFCKLLKISAEYFPVPRRTNELSDTCKNCGNADIYSSLEGLTCTECYASRNHYPVLEHGFYDRICCRKKI